MKRMFLFFFLCCSGAASAQWDIDKDLNGLLYNTSKSLDTICLYITTHASTDMERARGAYYWVAKTIRYDAKNYFKDKPSYTIPAEVFESRKAVCAGYAALFADMCTKMGIPCAVISGYSKGFGYHNGQPLYEPDHAWNAFLIKNEWHLVDATWAAGTIHKRLFRKFVRNFNDNFFNIPPREFVLKHLPEIPAWQLLDHPVSIKLFSGDEGKIYEFLNKTEGHTYSFNDTLLSLKNDILYADQRYAAMAFRFNPQNPFREEYQMQYAISKKLKGKIYHEDSEGYVNMNKAEINTVIKLLAPLTALLEKSKCSRKSTAIWVNETLYWSRLNTAEMYLARSQSAEITPLLKTTNSFDTLQHYSKPALEDLILAANAIQLAEASNRKEYILKAYCDFSLLGFHTAMRLLDQQTEDKKKKYIRKETELFIQNAKKTSPKECSCYKELQELKLK
jgi:hypothetical protein